MSAVLPSPSFGTGKVVDLSAIARELLPRRVLFRKVRRPDYIPRPQHVVDLNPKRRLAGATDVHQAFVGEGPEVPPHHEEGIETRLSQPAGPLGGKGVRARESFDVEDDDPLYAIPEVVLCDRSALPSSTWAEVRPAACGLHNAGNTCFVNSVLQCFAHSPPLAQFLERVTEANQQDCTFDPLFSLGETIRSMRQRPTRGAMRPSRIVNSLKAILPRRSFRPGMQGDASEFAIKIFDMCHSVLLRRLLMNRSKPSLIAEATSPINRIIGGYLVSRVSWSQDAEVASLRRNAKVPHQVVCEVAAASESGNFESNTFEPSTVLSIPVTGKTLEKCLRAFCASDTIDGYRTPRGGEVTVSRRTLIHIPPQLLILHLKRFDNGFSKLRNNVEYPADLDISQFVTVDGKRHFSTKYKLCGVVVHLGSSLTSGHYTAFVMAASGIWHEADDESVRPCGNDAAFRQQAFMLFYVRQDSSFEIRQSKSRYKSGGSLLAKELRSLSPDSVPRVISGDIGRELSSAEVDRIKQRVESLRTAQEAAPAHDRIDDDMRSPQAPLTHASGDVVNDSFSPESSVLRNTMGVRHPHSYGAVVGTSNGSTISEVIATKTQGHNAARTLASHKTTYPELERRGYHGKFTAPTRDAAYDGALDRGRASKKRSRDPEFEFSRRGILNSNHNAFQAASDRRRDKNRQ